jgi:hypothetical protein
MRLLFFLLFAFGVFMSIPVTAQKSQIKGHIIDAKTGELISYASVKIDNVNALTADSTGFFRIDLEPGKYKFTLSKIGYTTLFQTVRLGVEESLNVTFGMESFVNVLKSVVI